MIDARICFLLAWTSILVELVETPGAAVVPPLRILSSLWQPSRWHFLRRRPRRRRRRLRRLRPLRHPDWSSSLTQSSTKICRDFYLTGLRKTHRFVSGVYPLRLFHLLFLHSSTASFSSASYIFFFSPPFPPNFPGSFLLILFFFMFPFTFPSFTGLAKNTILWKNPVLSGFFGFIRIKSCVFSNVVFFQKCSMVVCTDDEIMMIMTDKWEKNDFICTRSL